MQTASRLLSGALLFLRHLCFNESPNHWPRHRDRLLIIDVGIEGEREADLNGLDLDRNS